MRHYPLFLNLAGRDVLVVGAGIVGRRKICSLQTAGPRSITVIDPAELPYLGASVVHERRAFSPADVAGKFLVFAATHLQEVNALVAATCHAQHILCNIVDAPDESDFFVPASVSSGEITVAIATGGASPALARRMRIELEDWLGNRYTALTLFLGRVRPKILALALGGDRNTKLFRMLVNSSLGELLASGRHEEAHTLLLNLLPEGLHSSIEELLHDI